MSTINFPDTTGQPTDGTFTYEFEGIIYIWDGEKWFSQGHGSTSSTVGDGHLIFKDGDGNQVALFTANQPTGSNTEVTLPEGGGGGGGFSGDYNDLSNKPDIPAAISELTDDIGIITDAGVTKIVAGTNVTIDPADGTGEVTINSSGGGGGGGFSGDYNDLSNKPDIPDSPDDIGAATAAQGLLADSSIQPGVVNPVYFANQAAFPSATDNHGAIAHSHADGAMYFAHGGVWNEMANAGDIPSDTGDLTNSAGFITDAGVTKIVAGSNITVSGDGTGEVTIDSTGGGGGGTNQDLSYADGGKDGAGTVQITDGTDATIPVVSSGQAGLMTGSQKELLDNIVLEGGGFSGNYNDLSNKPTIPTDNNQLSNGAGYITAAQVPSGGLDATSVTAPLEIDSNKNLKINYDRGLTNWLDRLEVDAGRGLNFNSSKVQVSAPAKDVANFEAINIQNNATSTYSCSRGELGHSGVWQGNFTIPDGAVGFVAIIRTRANLIGTIDKNVDESTIYQTIWAESAGFKITFSNNVSSNESAGGFIGYLGSVPKNNRGVGGHAVKSHIVYCSGSGDRTVNYRADSYTSDSNGASPSICQMKHDGFNMTIIPFGATY